MIKIHFLFLVVLLLASCGTTKKQATPNEIKMMTTKQIESEYNTVFTSAIALLQSEGFLVTSADKETGLINASKQVDNEKANLQKFLWGSAKEASTAQISFFVEKLNDNLTEVKLTIYEGSIEASEGGFGVMNRNVKNSMVQDATIYATWFNNLKAEIERRKALH